MEFRKAQKGNRLIGKEASTKMMLEQFERRLEHYVTIDETLDSIEDGALKQLNEDVLGNKLNTNQVINLYHRACSANSLRKRVDLASFAAASGYVFDEEAEAEDVAGDQLADRRMKQQVETFLYHALQGDGMLAKAMKKKEKKS